ncbi:EamA family transporter RarD [Psychrobium sp. 1_MG-2023]|uniref:EamA family transporter RarD n=1 Tax=Psychrobium sp. 1_MG-2023 TaxID=3062624 RepID=UPI000C32748E|nr:EamA family transporter RarD [Psychrobium sp. 1_MG-2023]MDP2562001.1 EamA family transporter RarD [Psychrobium sp. 1_MG-2023]PKF58617.1 EamA family transporter RarD [Alteromonadales bacterium alter-6D02]
MLAEQRYKHGLMFAFSAYIMWGIAPLYFKALGDIGAVDILLHRVVWSFAFVLIVIALMRGFSNIKQLFAQRKKILLLAVTSVIIAFNWLLFIWAINNDRMLDASLGYYINPLFNILLGTVFLAEKLRRLQWAAVALAAIAVLVELISFGSIPWVSLALASSFGIYGLLRKKINIDALSGLFVETLFLLPVALAYLWLIDHSSIELLMSDLTYSLLLVAAGVVTTLPLLAFSAAAIRIPLSTLGFIQYIGPSLMLLLAVFVYGEAFSMEKAITFGFIWLALIVYSYDGLMNHRRKKQALSAG